MLFDQNDSDKTSLSMVIMGLSRYGDGGAVLPSLLRLVSVITTMPQRGLAGGTENIHDVAHNSMCRFILVETMSYFICSGYGTRRDTFDSDGFERAAKGEDLMGMTPSEIVTEPNGRYYRFMKPIVAQPHCLLCHGPAEHVPEEIKTVLKTTYPFDQAIGYQVGDLRGAVSIKRPLGAE